MKTIKKFRAWKNNRLIPNAFPYSENKIIVGATVKNGVPILKIDEVDSIEQMIYCDYYEGDIVLSWNSLDNYFIGVVSLTPIEDYTEEEYLAAGFEIIRYLDKEDSPKEDFIQDIVCDGIFLGTIHENKKPEDWIRIAKEKINELRKRYDDKQN